MYCPFPASLGLEITRHFVTFISAAKAFFTANTIIPSEWKVFKLVPRSPKWTSAWFSGWRFDRFIKFIHILVIGGDPGGEALTVFLAGIFVLFGDAGCASAVDIGLHCGRIHDIFKCHLGTANRDEHGAVVEYIRDKPDTFIGSAQDVFDLGGAAFFCAERFPVDVEDLVVGDHEGVVLPVCVFVPDPDTNGNEQNQNYGGKCIGCGKPGCVRVE